MNALLRSIILLTCYFASSQSEELTLTVRGLNARFPLGIRSLQGVYDGEDSIFLFGGATVGSRVADTIFKYSISQDQIEQVGVMARGEMNGRVIADKEGKMYYIAGEIEGRFIQMFDGVNFNATILDVLGTRLRWEFGTIDLGEGNWAFYGGRNNSEHLTLINQFSFDTLKLTPIGTLPEGLYQRAVLAFRWEDTVYYLFQPDAFEVYGVTHDLLTNTTETFRFDTVPRISSTSSVSGVFDGKLVYTFSGDFNSIGVPIAWRFDPATHTAEEIRLVSYSNYYILQETCGVYVPKQDRVYFFGGTSGSMYRTSVMYVDLDLPAPTTTEKYLSTTPSEEEPTFNCTGRIDGDFYANPEECAEYFGCWDNTAYAFKCPEPLLFEVASQSCRFPDNVDCELHCDGKETGLYPHPYYCNLYRYCKNGEMEIIQCWSHYIFDVSIGICGYPVECLTDIY